MGEPFSIGIIGGGGWLGRAIAEAIIDAQTVAAEHLTLSHRSGQPDFLPNATWTRDNQELVDRSDVIIVSVRPQDWPAIDITASGKLAMSVMAGITLDQLAGRLKTDRVVRTLPNAAAEVRNSYTPWISSQGVTADDRNVVRRILEACGAADEVKTEADIDYLTGLTGSGPAFPALLAAAMMDDALQPRNGSRYCPAERQRGACWNRKTPRGSSRQSPRYRPDLPRLPRHHRGSDRGHARSRV